jgi:hypothetical protein
VKRQGGEEINAPQSMRLQGYKCKAKVKVKEKVKARTKMKMKAKRNNGEGEDEREGCSEGSGEGNGEGEAYLGIHRTSESGSTGIVDGGSSSTPAQRR